MLNMNQPRVNWMIIALLGLRLAEISYTVTKQCGDIVSKMNSQTSVKSFMK